MDLIDNIKVEDADSKSQDVLGRVYEYFLGKFADAGGSGVASSLPHEVL